VNFGEPPLREVRRNVLPRTPVNKVKKEGRLSPGREDLGDRFGGQGPRG
jgi:hypothetical protein